MNQYKPIIYSNSIYSINYKKLKEKGIKLLLFDIDHTIAKTNEYIPQNSVVSLFKRLEKNAYAFA